MILTGEELGPDRKATIENLFKSQVVRSYFADSVYQDKFDEGKHHVLSEKGFEDLNYLFFHSFLLCNNNPAHFDDIRLLTKSSFHYKYM
jgi:hypothetical protein